MMQEWISAQDSVKNTPLTPEQDIPWFWLVVPQQQHRHSTGLRGLAGLWAAVETPELSLPTSQLLSHTVGSQVDLPVAQSRPPICSVNSKHELPP